MFENNEIGPDVQVATISGLSESAHDTQYAAEALFASLAEEENRCGCGAFTSGTKIASHTLLICDRCLIEFVRAHVGLIKYVAQYVNDEGYEETIGRFATPEDRRDGVKDATNCEYRKGRRIVAFEEIWSAGGTGFESVNLVEVVGAESWPF